MAATGRQGRGLTRGLPGQLLVPEAVVVLQDREEQEVCVCVGGGGGGGGAEWHKGRGRRGAEAKGDPHTRCPFLPCSLKTLERHPRQRPHPPPPLPANSSLCSACRLHGRAKPAQPKKPFGWVQRGVRGAGAGSAHLHEALLPLPHQLPDVLLIVGLQRALIPPLGVVGRGAGRSRGLCRERGGREDARRARLPARPPARPPYLFDARKAKRVFCAVVGGVREAHVGLQVGGSVGQWEGWLPGCCWRC